LFAEREQLSVAVIGGGNNLLVRDRGVRGVVLRLEGCLGRAEFHGEEAIVGAGVSLSALIREAAALNLGGIECLVGIPATIGGALAMNAGTADGWIGDLVSAVYFLHPDGSLGEFKPTSGASTYRAFDAPPGALRIGGRLRPPSWRSWTSRATACSTSSGSRSSPRSGSSANNAERPRVAAESGRPCPGPGRALGVRREPAGGQGPPARAPARAPPAPAPAPGAHRGRLVRGRGLQPLAPHHSALQCRDGGRARSLPRAAGADPGRSRRRAGNPPLPSPSRPHRPPRR